LRMLIIGINYALEETGIAPFTARLAEHLAALRQAAPVEA